MSNFNLNQKLSEWNTLFLNWKNLQSQLITKYKTAHGGIFSTLSERPLIWDLIKKRYPNILLILTLCILVLEFTASSFSFFEAFQSCLFFSLIIAYFMGKNDQKKYDEKMKLINDIDAAFDLANQLLEDDINVNYDNSRDPNGSEFEKSIEPYLDNMKEFMDEKERRETQSNVLTKHLLKQAEESYESASSHLKSTNDHLMKIVGKHYKK
jgi:hypothetical protein